MSATYFLTNLQDTTDTAETAQFAKTSVGVVSATLTASIAKSTSNTWLFNTEYNIPRQATWGTQTITMSVHVTASGTSVAGAIAVKNLTTAQTSAFGTSVAMTAAGTFTLSAPSTAFTGTSVGDRLQVQLKVTNSATASRTFTFTVNTSTGSSITSPITEFSDQSGVVLPSAQYANDRVTIVPAGAATGTDGNSTPLYLEQDVLSYGLGYNTTGDFEVVTSGSSFSNSATNTTNAFKFREPSAITARRGSCMSYDSKNKRYLVVGGYDGTTHFNDLWQIDATQAPGRWRLLAPTGSGPAVFNLGASTQVNLNGKSWLIQYGGANSSNAATGGLFICECTTPGSEVWTTVTQTGGPGTKFFTTHHMVTVPTSSTAADVYFFGGSSSTTFFNGLWKISLNLASTVPTSLTWTTVKAEGAVGNPPQRDGAILSYDAANGRLLLASGQGSSFWTDVWQYSIAGAAWTSLTTSGDTFAGREVPSGGYDAVNQRIVLFGGWLGAIANNRNDIFSIDVSGAGTAVYSQLKTNDTTNQDIFCFSSGAACVDTDRNIIVEFGQNGFDGTDKYMYAFDLTQTSGNYTLYGFNVQDFYRGADAPAFCYDTDRSLMVLVNGYSTMDDDQTIVNGDHMNQVWTYDLTNNKIRYANSGFLGMPYKEGVAAVYDTVGQRIITFGGLTGTGNMSQEVWSLTADASGNYKARWMNPTGTKPGVRWLCAIAYDATLNRVIIWGGENSTAVLADAWQLDLTSGDGAWTLLSPTGTAPTGVAQPGYTNDTTNSRLFVYGGATNQALSTFSSQVFYIDYSTSTPSYHIPTPTGGTAARGRALGYDATNNRLFAWGGETGSAVIQTLETLNITTPTAWSTATPAVSPPARRSPGYAYFGGKLYVTKGRQHTGQFYNDLWELTPNFVTLSSSTWSNKNPDIYERLSVPITGLTNGTTYKWQSWESTSSVLSSKVVYNTNSFTVGTIALSVSIDPSNLAYFVPNLNVVVV